MTNRMHAVSATAALMTMTLLSGGRVAAAQSTPAFDTRWQAWLGCWQPSDVPVITGAKVTTLCVSPINSASAVQVTMLEDTTVRMRDTIDASGVARHVDKQGCVGTETGTWSADNRRVFVHTNLNCGAGLARAGNTIVAMTPGGEWLNVQTLTVGGSTGVRGVHYRDASALKTLPFGFANDDRQMAITSARANAGGSLDVRAVVEAVKRTDTAAVQTWIVERGTRFNLDAKQLMALADAGVPGSVTDVMVGLSYPERFALKSSSQAMGNGYGVSADRSLSQLYDDGLYNNSYYSPYSFYSRFSYYSPYSYYGYGYGYGAYGYNAAPVVIVRGSDASHGKVVNGHGYSQGSSGSSASSGSSRASGSSSSGSSGSGGSSSSSGSSSGASSSSSSGGRTAHPRPPV